MELRIAGYGSRACGEMPQFSTWNVFQKHPLLVLNFGGISCVESFVELALSYSPAERV